MTRERAICIHGHFYQPPRENPWLESVEIQDSADPYHDWNERIAAECYRPNADSRILDDQDRIDRIVNNYARISFNFGPTLLSWLERHDRQTYQAVLRADRESRDYFSGHGSALAQVYNHAILPLANRRDKLTQVRWGIRDFESRFGRRPGGMWLPETAADSETLEILADHGIRFTILAPQQASQTKRPATDRWIPLGSDGIDTSRPYVFRPNPGSEIALFFYHGPVSQAVAFERLLGDGRKLAQRLIGAFDDFEQRSGLVHIATDGETYGHHHRHGDMALAAALQRIEQTAGVRLTNYGEYLERHPPVDEVRIVEASAWSCAHGVGRWREACGCNGGHPGWQQDWRAPLRESLNWLRDRLATLYEASAPEYLSDPWAARDAYIDVILDRSEASIQRFLSGQTRRELDRSETVCVRKMLEMQRHAQLMFTSCGWFFDEISGIETVQILQYASRAMQLAFELYSLDLEPRFLQRLERAPSNVEKYENGRRTYEMRVVPRRVDLCGAAANAAALLFHGFEAVGLGQGYTIRTEQIWRSEPGRPRWIVGRLEVRSETTAEVERFEFCFVHGRQLDLIGSVRTLGADDKLPSLESLRDELDGARRDHTPAILRRGFDGPTWGLPELLQTQQRQIVDRLTESILLRADEVFENLYREHEALMRVFSELEMPAPRPLRAAAEQDLNRRLDLALQPGGAGPAEWERLRREAENAGATLDAARLALPAQVAVERLFEELDRAPEDAAQLERALQSVQWVRTLPFEVDLRRVENCAYRLLHEAYADPSSRNESQVALARFLRITI